MTKMTIFKIYQNLCFQVDFYTTFLSICRKTLFFFGMKSASLCKISLFAVNDLLFYLFELHIFPSPRYIHTLQLNFLFSDWLFNKYVECIENSTALRILRQDCARCFWCVITRANVTSTDPFFHWVKLLIFFMFSGILKSFYL